jgi:uncharacterized metal-binding protein YceD (DUF177 family)
VKLTNAYTIPYKGLKEGVHQFIFKIDGHFFDQIENADIQEADLQSILDVDKSGAIMRIGIEIKGTVEVECDRCLSSMSCDIDYTSLVWVKQGHSEDEMDEGNEELLVVPADQGEIDMWQYIYDSVMLSLPYQRVHTNEPGEPGGCDPLMIEKLNAHVVHEVPEEKEDNVADPRWEALLKLKGNKNNNF